MAWLAGWVRARVVLAGVMLGGLTGAGPASAALVRLFPAPNPVMAGTVMDGLYATYDYRNTFNYPTDYGYVWSLAIALPDGTRLDSDAAVGVSIATGSTKFIVPAALTALPGRLDLTVSYTYTDPTGSRHESFDYALQVLDPRFPVVLVPPSIATLGFNIAGGAVLRLNNPRLTGVIKLADLTYGGELIVPVADGLGAINLSGLVPGRRDFLLTVDGATSVVSLEVPVPAPGMALLPLALCMGYAGWRGVRPRGRTARPGAR